MSTSVTGATRDLSHTWSVSKTGSSQSGLAGETLTGGTWTINASEASSGSSFISGIITVKNLTGDELPLSVSAVMDDGSGLQVDCPETIRSLQEVACACKGNVGNAASVLTVAASVGSHNATQSLSVNFNTTVTGASATLTDTVHGTVVLNQTLVAGQGPWTFTVTDQPFTCPTQQGRAQYPNGILEAVFRNSAFLEVAGGQKAGASADVIYTCKAGFADVIKRTSGVVNPNIEWLFPLFNGPDGFTSNWSNLIGGVSSLGDADGVLEFATALSPNRTYTVCEAELPASWSAIWQVNGEPVVPYNPDADQDPPEDLGNRCVDFGAGTPHPVAEGEVVTFSINNRPPGTPGDEPRTPGYWKNWNRCTNGGQAANADRQAVRAGYPAGQGWRVDFWLIEDVLNPLVGGGITWDDMAADALLVPITSCEQAVEILDSRVVSVNGRVSDGKKLSKDPARLLARNLLAAQFNVAAGACTTQAALDAMTAAEALLDSINFTGTLGSAYLTTGSVAQRANALAGILDAYNNGQYCGAPQP